MMPSPHGTRSRYNKGCRCSACRKANTAYSLKWELRVGKKKYGAKKWEQVRPKATHGTQHMYSKLGCRCLACTDAASDGYRQWSPKTAGRALSARCPHCSRKFLPRGLPLHIGKKHQKTA